MLVFGLRFGNFKSRAITSTIYKRLCSKTFAHFNRMLSKPGTGVWKRVYSGNSHEKSSRVVPPISVAEDTTCQSRAAIQT